MGPSIKYVQSHNIEDPQGAIFIKQNMDMGWVWASWQYWKEKKIKHKVCYFLGLVFFCSHGQFIFNLKKKYCIVRTQKW